METILIAGIDTLVGANLAACYSESHQVAGVAIADSATETLADVAPDRLILCGSMSESYWLNREAALPANDEIRQLREWAAAGNRHGCQVTLISSDAVFTGPWMFHAETSDCYCESKAAETLRKLEREVLCSSPDTLVVRTNIFGWSPLETTASIAEMVTELQQQTGGPYCSTCHATPMLASDFASLLEAVHAAELKGICHIGGGERVNLQVFATKLAEQFDLPYPQRTSGSSLTSRPTGFLTGEQSLRSQRVRQELGLALPMLSDGLARLHAQSINGYRDELISADDKLPLRAA